VRPFESWRKKVFAGKNSAWADGRIRPGARRNDGIDVPGKVGLFLWERLPSRDG
jgi:hypothetical protein